MEMQFVFQKSIQSLGVVQKHSCLASRMPNFDFFFPCFGFWAYLALKGYSRQAWGIIGDAKDRIRVTKINALPTTLSL